MLSYTLRRLIGIIPVLFVVSLLVFAFIKLMPGDPARIYAGPDASLQAVESARHQLGLDQPLPQQYFGWLNDLIHGDLGVGYRNREPVASSIAQSFLPTLWLSLVAFIWSSLAGIGIGVFAARHKGRWIDYTLMTVAVVGISLPSFWLGLLLIQYVAVPFHAFSTSGYSKPTDVVLPALTLGYTVAAVMARYTRSAYLEAASEDYVRTARAKGLTNRMVVWKHTFRNALIPIVTMLGLQFGFLLSGSIVIETVFSWPGLGWLLIESIKAQDQPVIQALVMLFVTTFLVVNLIVDLLYGLIDPAARQG